MTVHVETVEQARAQIFATFYLRSTAVLILRLSHLPPFFTPICRARLPTASPVSKWLLRQTSGYTSSRMAFAACEWEVLDREIIVSLLALRTSVAMRLVKDTPYE